MLTNPQENSSVAKILLWVRFKIEKGPTNRNPSMAPKHLPLLGSVPLAVRFRIAAISYSEHYVTQLPPFVKKQNVQ